MIQWIHTLSALASIVMILIGSDWLKTYLRRKF